MGQPENAAAPGGLGLVAEFVNSLDYPDGEDELATEASASAWLRRHGAPVRSVSGVERAGLVALRENLRDLLEGNGEGPVSPGTADSVMQRFNAAELATVISPEGARLVATGSGVNRFVGELAAAMIAATTDGTWRRLKVCRSDECRYAFYDNTKNARRAWCSMRVCGCRSKSRTYRARKRGAVAGA